MTTLLIYNPSEHNFASSHQDMKSVSSPLNWIGFVIALTKRSCRSDHMPIPSPALKRPCRFPISLKVPYSHRQGLGCLLDGPEQGQVTRPRLSKTVTPAN